MVKRRMMVALSVREEKSCSIILVFGVVGGVGKELTREAWGSDGLAQDMEAICDFAGCGGSGSGIFGGGGRLG
jgi:hypothetical protein